MCSALPAPSPIILYYTIISFHKKLGLGLAHIVC